jgi:hypothetical protein
MPPFIIEVTISWIGILYVLQKKKAFPLSLRTFIVLDTIGFVFFLIAAYLTGILEPLPQFEEAVLVSEKILKVFGTGGLYLKVLIVYLLSMMVKIRFPKFKFLIDIDEFVILWFLMGFFDFINDFFWYLTI